MEIAGEPRGQRLDQAQNRTTEALRGLERSFAGLDQRLRAAEGRVEPEGVREAARFEKLAEAYGWKGMRCDHPADLDDAILEMINTKVPVMFDCRVAKLANCFPMIPSGKAHNEMLLGEDVSDEDVGRAIGKEGKVLV